MQANNYLSQLLSLPVRDRSGEKIAYVKDLISTFGPDYPPVIGIMARARRRDFFIVWQQIGRFDEQGVHLSTYKLDLQPFARREGEILLARDLLDKQIIDVNGRRVVRVNDVQLAATRNGLRLVGVDVSFRGLLRRLLPQNLLREERLPVVIDWSAVEYLATEAPAVKLNVSYERIAKLHPVDIARLAAELSYKQSAEIMRALDLETAADAMEEMSPELQAEIIKDMKGDEAAQILDYMEPDDVADLLGDLSEDKARELLTRMSPEESEDVIELMAYDENSAGGKMTNEFVILPVGLTTQQAIDYIRALEEKPDPLYDLYVVDDEQSLRLLGVVSLRDLVLAPPDAELVDLMEHHVITVAPEEEGKTVARTMAEYNLLSIPVLDAEQTILGIVTVDDAMELLLGED